MSAAGVLVVVTVLLVFLALALTRVPAHLVLSAALALLVVTGTLPAHRALLGFANEGVITIAVLFVVVAGLKQTGALALIVRRLMGHPTSERAAHARLAGPVVVGSAFLNNTPIVAMMLPAVLDWCRANRLAPSRMLMPLSYMAILGGLCTLIGTSTNLAIHGLLLETGHPPLNMFSLAPIGLACAAAGIVYLLWVAPHLLPNRTSESAPFADPRRYSVEMVATEVLAGKTIKEAGLRRLPGLFLAEIHRDGEVLPAVEPTERLVRGDQLVFVGVVDSIVDLQQIPGLQPATEQVFRLDQRRGDRVFAEAVVSARGPLAGLTIRQGRFRNRYDAVVLAVSRNGERVPGRIGDIVLRPGDTLLVEGGRDFSTRWRNSSDFYLVSSLDGAPPSHERAPLALLILAAMIGLVATGLLSMLQAAMLAAAAMLLSGSCSENNARRSIDGPLLIALAAAFGIGEALHSSGVAAWIGTALVTVVGNDPWFALIAVYLVTTVLSELVTNNAAAVMMFPLALALSHEVSASITPFAIAIMIAASSSFATPLGYQTNLMVFGPGGYRVSDFIRVGVPLKILVALIAVVLIPVVWPLS